MVVDLHNREEGELEKAMGLVLVNLKVEKKMESWLVLLVCLCGLLVSVSSLSELYFCVVLLSGFGINFLHLF